MGTKISELTAVATPARTQYAPVVDGATTKRMTIAQMAGLVVSTDIADFATGVDARITAANLATDAEVAALLANYTLTSGLGDLALLDTVADAQVAVGAAIAYSKLNLTGAVLNADIVSLAASKLTGALPAISGAALTALNGTEITTGTVAAARIADLSATYLTVAAAASGYQPKDADLDALAALSASTGVLHRTGAGAFGVSNVVNADVDAAAAIAYSKLALTGSVVNADIVSLAASKLTGAVAIANGGTGLTALGTANQQLRVNAGATAIEWFTPSAGGSVAGSDTQVQFNDGGAFGADAGMTYAKATDTLTVGKLVSGAGAVGAGASGISCNGQGGILSSGANEITLQAAGFEIWRMHGSAGIANLNTSLSYGIGASIAGNVDVGFGRKAAGVGKITDGTFGSTAIMPLALAREPITKTSNYSVVGLDSNAVFDNIGAGGAVALSLPTPVRGMTFTAYVAAAQTFGFTATGSATIRDLATVGAANGTITSNVIGNRVTLYATSTTTWVVIEKGGTWTTA